MEHRRGTRVPVAITVGLVVAVIVGGVAIASFVRGSNPAPSNDGARSNPIPGSIETSPGATAPTSSSSPSSSSSSSSESSSASPAPSATEPSQAAAPAAQPNRPVQPADGTCSDVEVVFARGTGERAGLGILGTPLTSNLRQRLPGRTVTSYGVDYAAAQDQSSAGPGATDMSRHIADVAGRCPQTSFVIGGYSQGATVTDIAIGIRGVSRTTGETIAADVASQVVAVVVFGNPLGLGARTIETASPTYGPKAMSFCNTDDSVCGGGGAGSLPGSHLSYATNGSVPQAADFAAARVNEG